MPRRQLPPQIRKIDVKDRRTGKPVVRYQLTIDAGRDPETDRRRQIRRRYLTEKDARNALAELSNQAMAKTFVPRKAITLDELCGDWIESLHGARETTRAGYEYNLAPVREQYGDLPVQQLTRKHLDSLVAQLRAGGTLTGKGTARRPWSARSLNRTVATTAMVLEYAIDRKVVAHNVAAKIKPIPRPSKEMATFTPAEVRTVLDSVADDRDGHLWFLALSGLRRSEIGGLRWSDIDFDAKVLRIRTGRVSAGGKAVEGDPKTASSIRALPLDDGMAAVLRRAFRRQAEERLSLGEAYAATDYVACNEAGEPYHPDTLTHRWKKTAKAAGVREIRLHDCRHTAGTTMHLRNVPLAVIAAWLGHADASVTARIYAHSQDDALKAAGLSLAAVVTSRDTEAG